jgi:peptidoglycan/LPS O-acetylase OafA/YrhL
MGLLFATGLLPRIEVVAAIWLALAGLWSVVDQYFGIPLPAALPRLLIFPHVPYFVAGITLFLISLKRFTPARLALLLGALAVGGFSDALAGDQGAAMGWGAILQRLAMASLLVAIFALAVTGRLRFSISPVTLWLGGISYSLYLSHRNLGYLTLFRLQDAGVPAWASVLLTFAGALLLATALHYAVERPASHALRGWYRARRGVVAERS